jgi:nicotinamide riboside kinase
MAEAIRIAIVGAESTGKTSLASQLAARLAQDGGYAVAWVPEVLREWCDEQGRTPLAHEQAAIMRAQHGRIDAAAARHDIVVCDTTALMTAVYSRLIFDDRSLDEQALALHRGMSLTLLTALDLPWVADGHQRDGEHVREPVDGLLRQLLLAHRLPWAVIGGAGPLRVQQAVHAVAPLLRGRRAGARGPFTRLDEADDAAGRIVWSCACCSVPEHERALRRR